MNIECVDQVGKVEEDDLYVGKRLINATDDNDLATTKLMEVEGGENTSLPVCRFGQTTEMVWLKGWSANFMHA